jgi:hypothetical protein
MPPCCGPCREREVADDADALPDHDGRRRVIGRISEQAEDRRMPGGLALPVRPRRDASPYAVVLPGVQRKGQALPPDGAAAEIALACVTWSKGGTGRGDREEQFRGQHARHAASSRQSRAGIVIIWSPGGLGEVVICGRNR